MRSGGAHLNHTVNFQASDAGAILVRRSISQASRAQTLNVK